MRLYQGEEEEEISPSIKYLTLKNADGSSVLSMMARLMVGLKCYFTSTENGYIRAKKKKR